MSGVRIFSGACKKQILYGSAFFVLVRAYGKPVSNGVADHVTEKPASGRSGKCSEKGSINIGWRKE